MSEPRGDRAAARPVSEADGRIAFLRFAQEQRALPAIAGTLILLQIKPQCAPAGVGTLSVTAFGRDSFPQRGSQGAAAQGRAVNDCLYGVERESVRNSRRGEVTPPYERNSALHPVRIVHLVKFWRVDLWTSPKIGRDREVVLASFLRVWYTRNGLDRFFRCNIFYLGGLQ